MSKGLLRSELRTRLARLQHIERAAQSYAPLALKPILLFARTSPSDYYNKNRKYVVPCSIRLLKEEIKRECMVLETALRWVSPSFSSTYQWMASKLLEGRFKDVSRSLMQPTSWQCDRNWSISTIPLLSTVPSPLSMTKPRHLVNTNNLGDLSSSTLLLKGKNVG